LNRQKVALIEPPGWIVRRVEQVERLGADAEQQPIVLPHGLGHVLERLEDHSFTIGVYPANEDAVTVVAARTGTRRCLPGSAERFASQDDALARTDIKRPYPPLNIARTVVVAGWRVWAIPAKMRVDGPFRLLQRGPENRLTARYIGL
jgi:hypothetical protein